MPRREIKREEGMATLLTAVVMLVVVFLITYNMSETIIQDKRNVASAVWANDAFQRAHNGLDEGLAYVTSVGLNSITASTAGGSFTLPSSAISTDATVVFTELDNMVLVKSTAFSLDNSVTRTVGDRISGSPSVPGQPAVPVASRGAINIQNGNINVTNNYIDLTVWSGEDVVLGSSTTTKINIDGVDDQISNSNTTRGPDIVRNDENLLNATASEFLQSFFNVNALEDFCSGSKTVDTECFSESGAKTVYLTPDPWVDGDEDDCSDGKDGTDVKINLNDYTTTQENPVRIIVNGFAEVKLVGNTPFYGVVIANEIEFSGGGTVYGSMVAVDCMPDNGTGGGDIILDPIVISTFAGGGTKVKVAGGWHDF